MSADFFFKMGATHSVCQDYAVAGETADGVRYAVVSDGCSGGAVPGVPGSPFTDFGARFLVKAAERRAIGIAGGFWPAKSILADAQAAARVLSLPASALDATLIAAAVQGDGQVQVFQCGDGVVIYRERSGRIRYCSPEFAGNQPFYLSYQRDQALLQRYCELTQEATVTCGMRIQLPGAEPCWTRSASSVSVEQLKTDWSVFDPADVDLILLCSDGILSFQRTGGESVPVEEVIDQLLAIKSYQGQFVGRRCHNFFGKFCQENDWTHADDVAIAGIYLGETP